MNQILSTSLPVDINNNKSKRIGQSYSKKNIIKILSIVILIFGIFMIGIGGYSFVNNLIIESKNVEPVISLENKEEKILLLRVTHKRNISKLEYYWNDEEEIISENNGKKVEKEIEIPYGSNTLHIKVQDENGKEMTYEKVYELKSKINLEVVSNKIKISRENENSISYLTYRWDDGEETRIDINSMDLNQEIDVLKGVHTLTVTVVDEFNNKDVKVQKINGVSKPKIILDVDQEVKHFVVKASDDEKIKKIEIRLNQDDNQKAELNLEDKDYNDVVFTLPYELQAGENYIEVKVYSSNDVSSELGMRYMKQ